MKASPPMSVQEIHLQQEFAAPCERMFEWISVPDRMSEWTIGMRLRRLAPSPEPGRPDGVGSRRLATMFGLVRFEETILAYEPPHVFEYSITRGSPAKHQRGRQRLTAAPGGCRLDWHIRFEPRVPLTGAVIRVFVREHFARSLRGLARRIGEAPTFGSDPES